MRITSLAVLASALLTTSVLADANSDYLAANAKKPGVMVSSSGLQHKAISRTGNSAQKPGRTDCVTVNYKGTFIDGRPFDASQPGSPISFPVNRVIPGWTEALQMMHVGETWELTIPANLAYGANGTPDGTIPPNTPLVFSVELLKVSPHC
ncbi:MAG TPA: FKBP-type peptidyl-prolyl cis-trans isomerase [Rhizomicrobium sp.]|nr:FKBP-type peptidyl-prolyl cis-trans isomerase [Rhizomicrobium sp.]